MNPIISFLFLYNQYLLKQIDELLLELFNETNISNRPLTLRCPYCRHTLVAVKDRKHFRIHKYINSKCHYYRQNRAKLPKDLDDSDKHKYKLHYMYREFTMDFFKMDLHELPSRAVNFNAHIVDFHPNQFC